VAHAFLAEAAEDVVVRGDAFKSFLGIYLGEEFGNVRFAFLNNDLDGRDIFQLLL